MAFQWRSVMDLLVQDLKNTESRLNKQTPVPIDKFRFNSFKRKLFSRDFSKMNKLTS